MQETDCESSLFCMRGPLEKPVLMMLLRFACKSIDSDVVELPGSQEECCGRTLPPSSHSWQADT